MKKNIFWAFIALFIGIIFTACDKDEPISSTKENIEEESDLFGTWQAVEFTYIMPGTGGNTHTWAFDKLTKGCDVDLIEINKENAKLFVSNLNNNKDCETIVTNGKLNNGVIVFEGEEDRPRTVLSNSKGYLKLKYKFIYEGYPHIECDVLYKRVENGEVVGNEDVEDKDKFKHIGKWGAKEYTIVNEDYSSTQDISMLLPTVCKNYSVDELSINDNGTVELKFYRMGSCEPKIYKGKIDGNIIIFDQDKDNPRTITSNDGMFMNIKYFMDIEKYGKHDFAIMRFEKK